MIIKSTLSKPLMLKCGNTAGARVSARLFWNLDRSLVAARWPERSRLAFWSRFQIKRQYFSLEPQRIKKEIVRSTNLPWFLSYQ